ncbi:MAG: UpxY family transcription antiterminator [Prolixibacteraceae bacterium]|nr:UpxY family transcription antiterminator [Prolixibacteraceae bacterium]
MAVKSLAKEKKWHVVYTRSRAEKKVHADLKAMEIECFLPLQKLLRQWKDRKKWIEVPLMTGYCFVRINSLEFDKVLRASNVVAYVVFEKKAAVIPDIQIEYLQTMVRQSEFEIRVSRDTFMPGKRVEVIAGPLMGLQGELMEEQGKNHFVLRIEAINTVFMAVVPAENLTALPPVYSF